MNRTFYYKTLRGLLRQSMNNSLSVSNLISGRFYHKKQGWVSFRLSDDAIRNLVYGLCTAALGMRRDRDIVYSNILNHRIEDCGILGHLIVRYDTDGLRYSYYAGQDYPSETKLVRKLLRCK